MQKKKIGKRLRALRGDLSRAEVAKAVGLTPDAIAKYERDERVPKDPIKIKLAEFFNADIESIFFVK